MPWWKIQTCISQDRKFSSLFFPITFLNACPKKLVDELSKLWNQIANHLHHEEGIEVIATEHPIEISVLLGRAKVE
jgi:hypothetical protein